MEFRGKNLEEIVVTLPLADGTEMDCGVFAAFEVLDKTYLALLPLLEEKKLDFTKNYMLYRVEEDEEQNPVVAYIEDDQEYALAANFFATKYLQGN